ncbi:MAG: ExbD/TolR family protein [Vulcanimicrobiota bacterium]
MIKIYRKNKQKINSNINLTSMTDVLMTLIILFMLLETTQAVTGFQLDYQNSPTGAKPLKNKVVLLEVNARGMKLITDNQQEKISSEKHLADLLHNLNKKNLKTLIIKADYNIEYQKIIKLMEISKKQGFENINLAE